MTIQLGNVETPIGALTLAAVDGRVCLLHFDASERSARAALAKWYPTDRVEKVPDPGAAARVLRRYFDGDISALDDVVVEMNGTDFQKKVWAALRGVKAGPDFFVRRDREANRSSRRGARGGRGKWCEPGRNHRPLPSGDRRQWKPDRVRRRLAPEGVAAPAREGEIVLAFSAREMLENEP